MPSQVELSREGCRVESCRFARAVGPGSHLFVRAVRLSRVARAIGLSQVELSQDGCQAKSNRVMRAIGLSY